MTNVWVDVCTSVWMVVKSVYDWHYYMGWDFLKQFFFLKNQWMNEWINGVFPNFINYILTMYICYVLYNSYSKFIVWRSNFKYNRFKTAHIDYPDSR